MSPNKNFFTSYCAFNGGIVLIGNNVASKTVGIDEIMRVYSIRIKLHNGVVRMLTYVRHVPESKNLISLGALAINGCKYVLKGEDFKVFKSSFLVMKRNQS